MPVQGNVPACDAKLMILPAPCRSITRPTAWLIRNVPVRLTAKVVSQPAKLSSSAGAETDHASAVDQDVDAAHFVPHQFHRRPYVRLPRHVAGERPMRFA